MRSRGILVEGWWEREMRVGTFSVSAHLEAGTGPAVSEAILVAVGYSAC